MCILVAHASYAVIFMSESSIAKIQWSYLDSSTVYWMDRRRKKVQWPIEMFEASKPCVVCDDLLTQCKQNGSTHMIIHRSTASR